jgi:hypothetical protein
VTKETNSLFHLLTKGDYSRVNQDIFELVLYLFVVPMAFAYGVPKLLKLVRNYLTKKREHRLLEEKLGQERVKKYEEKERLYKIADQYVTFSVKGFARGGAIPEKELGNASLNEIRAGLVVFLLDLLSDPQAPHKKRLEAINGTKGLYEGIPYSNALRNDDPLMMEETSSAIWSFVVWADLMEMIATNDKGFVVDDEKVHRLIVKRLLIGKTESD